MFWFALALACSSDPEGPAAADPDTTETSEPVVLPLLSVESPAHGAFTGDGRVEVMGQVRAGTHAVAGVSINGQSVSTNEDGRFSLSLEPEPGLVIVGVRAEDVGGERAVDGRAVYHGPVHAPGALLPDALRLQIGAEMLDDDRPDMDDVAAIAEALLDDPSLLGALVGVPVDSGSFTLTPTSVSFSGADVDLVPQQGELIATITLHDLWMDFDVTDIIGWSWLSTDGSAWADAVTLELVLVPADGPGGVTIAATSATTTLDGWGLTVDWFPDSLEGLLADWTQGTIEDEVSGTAQELVGGLVADTLQAFAINTELADGLWLSMELTGLDVGTEGLRLTMDAGIEGSAGFDLPPGAGSLDTDENAPAWPIDRDSPFAVAVDDDFVNQLTFAFWATGTLSGIGFTGTELGGMTGSPLPAPLGPAAHVTLGLGLPPVMSPSRLDDMNADLGLGEFQLTIEREDGEVLDFSINVRAGADVGFDDAGMLAFSLDDRPAKVEMEIGVLSQPAALDPGDLAALVRLMVPPLLRNASAFMPGIETPALDLGEMSGLDSLQGVELVLQDADVTMNDDGWVLLTGALAAP